MEILDGYSDVQSDSESDSVEVTTKAATGLTDVSDAKGVPGRPQRHRLRRGEETSLWHPPLPEPPARHALYNRNNHYNPTILCISRLLGVMGNPPHWCFLVQWKGKPFLMSCVWE